MIKELWTLIKMLFQSRPSDCIGEELEVMFMKNFPFNSHTVMSWCGKMIMRDEYWNDAIRFLETNQGKELKTHEYGHVVQALLCNDSWFRFYLSYYWNWLKHGLMNPLKANYYINKYECEAFANQDKPEYWERYDGLDLDYRYTIKNAKKMWKEVGGNPEKWKAFVKTL